MPTPKHLDWQIGEETWGQRVTEAPRRRLPPLRPWLLILLAVALVWGWWRVIRPADVYPASTPLPATVTTPTPVATPTRLPRASSRLYHILQTEKGTRSLVVFNPLLGSVVRRLPVGNTPQFTLSPDGATLYLADFVTTTNGTTSRLRIFDTRSWSMLRQTELPNRVRWPRNAGPPALIMAPDGLAIYAQRLISQTYTVDRLDPTTGELAASGIVEPLASTETCSEVRFVFAAANGRWLYDLCRNGVLHFNDLQRRTVSRSLSLPLAPSPQSQASVTHSLAGAVMSADSQFLYTVTEDGILTEVDLSAGRVVSEVLLPLQAGHRVMPFQVAQLETPHSLVLGLSHGSEGEAGLASEIWFYNLETRELANQWVVDPPFANLAVSPDLWEVETPLSSLALHSNDQVLVTSDPYGQQLVVYNLLTGAKLRTITDSGSAWSSLVLAPAPATAQSAQATSHERLYLVDAGGPELGASVHVIDADSNQQMYAITVTYAAAMQAPEVAVTLMGDRLWLLDGAEQAGQNRLHLLDTASGLELAQMTILNRLTRRTAGGWPPLISSDLGSHVMVQHATPVSSAVWLENYLATPPGISQQVEAPFWYKTPLCGPSHLLWRASAQQLLVLCQPETGPARLTVLSLDTRRPMQTLTLPAVLQVRSGVLSPDESILYALADGPAVLPIHLEPLLADAPVPLAIFDIVGRPLGQPVLSADGNTLYLALTFPADPLAFNTLLGTAWAVDTQNWRLKTRLGMERTFIDLGLSQDGQRLYALDATIALNAYTHNIFVFDTQLNVLIRKIPNEAVNPVRLIVAPAPP